MKYYLGIEIGGGLSLIGEPLFNRINASLSKYVVQAFHPVPEVKIAKLGEDVGLHRSTNFTVQAEIK